MQPHLLYMQCLDLFFPRKQNSLNSFFHSILAPFMLHTYYHCSESGWRKGTLFWPYAAIVALTGKKLIIKFEPVEKSTWMRMFMLPSIRNWEKWSGRAANGVWVRNFMIGATEYFLLFKRYPFLQFPCKLCNSKLTSELWGILKECSTDRRTGTNFIYAMVTFNFQQLCLGSQLQPFWTKMIHNMVIPRLNEWNVFHMAQLSESIWKL